MGWNVSKAIEHLRKQAISHAAVLEATAHHRVVTGHCAQRTREAIEAGGLKLQRHHSAKDYGTSLLLAGFHVAVGPVQAGDVVIIQPIQGHPHGHVAMYDGQHWISDFVQNDVWPGSSYRKTKPPYTIYRHGLQDHTDVQTSGACLA